MQHFSCSDFDSWEVLTVRFVLLIVAVLRQAAGRALCDSSLHYRRQNLSLKFDWPPFPPPPPCNNLIRHIVAVSLLRLTKPKCHQAYNHRTLNHYHYAPEVKDRLQGHTSFNLNDCSPLAHSPPTTLFPIPTDNTLWLDIIFERIRGPVDAEWVLWSFVPRHIERCWVEARKKRWAQHRVWSRNMSKT